MGLHHVAPGENQRYVGSVLQWVCRDSYRAWGLSRGCTAVHVLVLTGLGHQRRVSALDKRAMSKEAGSSDRDVPGTLTRRVCRVFAWRTVDGAMGVRTTQNWLVTYSSSLGVRLPVYPFGLRRLSPAQETAEEHTADGLRVPGPVTVSHGGGRSGAERGKQRVMCMLVECPFCLSSNLVLRCSVQSRPVAAELYALRVRVRVRVDEDCGGGAVPREPRLLVSRRN